MPSLHRMRRERRRALAAAGAGGAVVVAAVAGRVARARARRGPAEPAVPRTPLPPPAAADTALDGLLERGGHALAPLARNGDQASLGAGVADAYRRARQTYGAVSERLDDDGLDRLHAATRVLWAAATFAEPFAAEEGRRLARRSREVLALLEEHAELRRLRAAAVARGADLGPGTLEAVDGYAAARRGKLERRVLDRGGRLFAGKPARVARRIADDDPLAGPV